MWWLTFQRKTLRIRKYFQQKSSDHICDVIYGPHLSDGMLIISFQLIQCQKCLKNIIMFQRVLQNEWRMQICFKL